MVIQYPHLLTGTITANAVFDEVNGDWVQGAETSFTIKCRAESNQQSSGFINSKDGVKIDYDWVVYIPNPVPPIQVGTTVTVSDNGVQFLNDTVKRFSKGQLNSRVWL